MDGSVQRSRRRAVTGGIAGLATIVSEHRKAVSYDLLTLTGYQLSDIGRGLDWASLRAFLENVPADGALMRELHPELATWTTRAKSNAILADIFDALSAIDAHIVALGTGKAVKKPKPYPRPHGQKKQDDNVRHFGRGALPVNELEAWFERKRQEHASSS